MQTDQKKKAAADPSLKDCANCGTTGAKLTCAKCKATHYCCKACETQHWKNGHRALCVTPEERRPGRPRIVAPGEDGRHRRSARAADVECNSGECPICLGSLTDGTLCILPCKHEFHGNCVEELRKQGVQQVCPLCRTTLPAGPIKLFEDATCIYYRMKMRHQKVDESWNPLTSAEKKNQRRESRAHACSVQSWFHLSVWLRIRSK